MRGTMATCADAAARTESAPPSTASSSTRSSSVRGELGSGRTSTRTSREPLAGTVTLCVASEARARAPAVAWSASRAGALPWLCTSKSTEYAVLATAYSGEATTDRSTALCASTSTRSVARSVSPPADATATRTAYAPAAALAGTATPTIHASVSPAPSVSSAGPVTTAHAGGAATRSSSARAVVSLLWTTNAAVTVAPGAARRTDVSRAASVTRTSAVPLSDATPGCADAGAAASKSATPNAPGVPNARGTTPRGSTRRTTAHSLRRYGTAYTASSPVSANSTTLYAPDGSLPRSNRCLSDVPGYNSPRSCCLRATRAPVSSYTSIQSTGR